MNLKAGSLAHRTATTLERTVDQAAEWYHRQFGYRNPVRVVPYMGFGTPKHVQFRGRVLADGQVQDRDEMHVARNILHMLQRYKTNEVPMARLLVRFGGQEREVVTDGEGYFHVVLKFDEPFRPGHLLEPYEVVLHDPLKRGGQPKTTFHGCVQIPDDARFAVISDVDDTIVHTGASDFLKHARTVLLNNARTRTPFPGVAPFYRGLQNEQGRPANPIFYVSSSPWNLYELFADFMDHSDIPMGTMFLKDFGMDKDHWIKTSHGKYKLDRIQEVLRTYPQLGVILVGDSGQKDPEIYAKIVRENRDRVLAVYLRDVVEHMRPITDTVARDIRKCGVPCVLMEDTLAAAEHAAEHGWIEPHDFERVRRHVGHPEEDERTPGLVGVSPELI